MVDVECLREKIVDVCRWNVKMIIIDNQIQYLGFKFRGYLERKKNINVG